MDTGALVEPLSVGWHPVSQSPLKPDSSVLVLGGGPIGISCILALRARGCGEIIVSELSSSRQKFAKHFGATHIIDPTKETSFVKKVYELTNGEGVDIVFDCAGVAAGLEAACQSIKPRGTIVNVAIWEKAVPFQPNNLVFREGKYLACLGYVQQDFKDVIQAISSGELQEFRFKGGRGDLSHRGTLWLDADNDRCYETTRYDHKENRSGKRG